MNKRDEAIIFDRERKYLEAIKSYEGFFEEDNPDREDYFNLIALYHEIQDPGMYLIGKDDLHAYQREFELLDELERKYGKQTEIDFWRRYTDWVRLGEEFDECEELAKRGDSLIPFFFLMSTTVDIEEKKKYLPECKVLYEQVKDCSTTYKRIIESLLKSSFDEIERADRGDKRLFL